MNNKILSTIILFLAVLTFSCKSTDAGTAKEDVVAESEPSTSVGIDSALTNDGAIDDGVTDVLNENVVANVDFPEMTLEANQDFASYVGDWKLVLLMKDGVAQTIAVAELSIMVDGDDDDTFSISGTLGENLFTGAMTSGAPNVLEVVSFGSTKMAVPPELVEFEYLYSELLAMADSYSVGKFPNESFTTLKIRSSATGSFAHFVRK